MKQELIKGLEAAAALATELHEAKMVLPEAKDKTVYNEDSFLELPPLPDHSDSSDEYLSEEFREMLGYKKPERKTELQQVAEDAKKMILALQEGACPEDEAAQILHMIAERLDSSFEQLLGEQIEDEIAEEGQDISKVPGEGCKDYDDSTDQCLDDVSEKEKRDLVAAKVTLNGRPAVISGIKEKFAKVRQIPSGDSAEFAWHTVRHIVGKGGKFKSESVDGYGDEEGQKVESQDPRWEEIKALESQVKRLVAKGEDEKADVLQDKADALRTEMEKDSLEEADPSLKPPKRWFSKMAREIKAANPSYSDDQVHNTIGKIWYHELSTEKKKEIRGREGKHYGPATESRWSIAIEGLEIPFNFHASVTEDQVKRYAQKFLGESVSVKRLAEQGPQTAAIQLKRGAGVDAAKIMNMKKSLGVNIKGLAGEPKVLAIDPADKEAVMKAVSMIGPEKVAKVGGRELMMQDSGGPKKMLSITFDRITPESAERGEPEESGYEDEGREIKADEIDLENGETDASLAAKEIIDRGSVEPSSTSFHPGVWYTTIDPDRDMRDGSETYYSFHLKGFSPEEEEQIFKMVMKKGESAKAEPESAWDEAELKQAQKLSAQPVEVLDTIEGDDHSVQIVKAKHPIHKSLIGIHLTDPSDSELEGAVERAFTDGFEMVVIHEA